MLVRPGSQVEKGQVLVSVAMPELAELMAELLSATARVEQQKASAEREAALIDGSVVMTEANLHRLMVRQLQLQRVLTPAERFAVILESSREILRSIIFGMIIIMLVFLPVLTLEVIEDKMFSPMAAIGGVVALYGRGIPFSVSAAIGFIALSGIAVLNGQVLIAAIRNQLAEGLAVQQAVIVAAKQRLVPVLTTAITDAVGFLPMALSLGVGAACVTVRPAFLLRMARLVLLTIYRIILTV